MNEDSKNRPLRLVGPNESRLHALASQEFGAGSFERILERADFYRADITSSTAGKFQDELWAQAVEEAPRLIARARADFSPDKLDWDKAFKHLTHITVNLGLDEFMADTNHPELPADNVAFHGEALVDCLRDAVLMGYTRENLDMDLNKICGLRMRGCDATRLLLYDINKDRIAPRILVIPNSYKPYNPFLALVAEESQFTMEQTKLLRIFSH